MQTDTPESMASPGGRSDTLHNPEIGLAPTKARNLRRMAEQIVEGGRGVRPDWDFLESLAGVGHKTAGVVMAQGPFGVPAFPVDTQSTG
ncbi:MAG: hypothetical protein CM1200mP32_08320 [Methanobacteriota archaeon]|nr:MAG: hypothetical protein CM1200mP32_08320 [Euryarchaeota archaeon]